LIKRQAQAKAKAYFDLYCSYINNLVQGNDDTAAAQKIKLDAMAVELPEIVEAQQLVFPDCVRLPKIRRTPQGDPR